MSEDSLNLVLLIKVHKSSSDMAKVQIKSEKNHPFWRNIFNHGAVWCPFIQCDWFYIRKALSVLRLQLQWNTPLPHVRVLLRWFLHWRCLHTSYEAFFLSSQTQDMQFWYDSTCHKRADFDDMNNGFGWKRLPKSFMSENTVYLLMTALIRNFYRTIIKRINVKDFGLSHTSRIKTFIFKYISVPAKWIKTSRAYRLNIYTDNPAYARVFKVGSD